MGQVDVGHKRGDGGCIGWPQGRARANAAAMKVRDNKVEGVADQHADNYQR